MAKMKTKVRKDRQDNYNAYCGGVLMGSVLAFTEHSAKLLAKQRFATRHGFHAETLRVMVGPPVATQQGKRMLVDA